MRLAACTNTQKQAQAQMQQQLEDQLPINLNPPLNIDNNPSFTPPQLEEPLPALGNQPPLITAISPEDKVLLDKC